MNVINYIEDDMEYNIKDINDKTVRNCYYCYYNIDCFKDNYYLKYLFEECDNNYQLVGEKYIKLFLPSNCCKYRKNLIGDLKF